MRTITLEEHYLSSGYAERFAEATAGADAGPAFEPPVEQLRDLGAGRLAAMDAGGIDVQVLSHATAGRVDVPAEEAVALTRAANDELAEAVAAHPDRFAGFATLPLRDPAAAVAELERAVTDLGFVGALINGTTDGAFLDAPRFRPVLEAAVDLDVPLYVHPGLPPAAVAEAYFEGVPPGAAFMLSSASWGWHAETGLHALRLVAAGVFDDLPGLRVILGHDGEMLPFMLDRIDDTLSPRLPDLDHDVSHYLRERVRYTTSGMFGSIPLEATIRAVGVEHVMFSIDYPFSATERGRAFLDGLDLDDAAMAKLTHENAERVLGLPGG